MDKLKFIKDEAKRLLQASIMEHKLKISDISKLEQKETLQRFLDKVLIRLLKHNRIDIEQEGLNLDLLREEVINELVGFGIVERIIKDPQVTDILVNNPDQIYIEKLGKLERVNLKFDNREEIIAIIERMIRESGKRLDTSSPFVDFTMEEGGRVTAVIPPISAGSPFFCIRKVLKDIFTFEDLKKFGTLDQKVLDFLKYCVRARLNILVSGSTGVGKSTLVNLMIKEFVPTNERIVIIEDTEEIVTEEPQHVVRLLTRSPNIEGKGEVTLRDLVKLSLHLRPDRIIIGEVRGEESFHFLHAINTGHEGSMCTIHANSSEDALNRLETLILMDRSNISPAVVRRFLKSGIDFIIHMRRLPSGQRIISQISEFEYKGDACLAKDIFALHRVVIGSKEIYEIKLTGHTPSFVDKLKVRAGLPDNFFTNR